jgi:hypothetical protein
MSIDDLPGAEPNTVQDLPVNLVAALGPVIKSAILELVSKIVL